MLHSNNTNYSPLATLFSPKLELSPKSVFFNLFAAAEPSANVFFVHGTLCNDPSADVAAIA